MSRPPSRGRGNSVDGVLRVAIALSDDVAGLLGIPLIHPAANLAKEVLDIIKDVRSEKLEWCQLARRCIRFLNDISKALSGNREQAPRSLMQDVNTLTSILESMHDDVLGQAGRSWFKKMRTRAETKGLIVRYNREIDDAIKSFQVTTLIHIRVSPSDSSPYSAPALDRRSSSTGNRFMTRTPSALRSTASLDFTAARTQDVGRDRSLRPSSSQTFAPASQSRDELAVRDTLPEERGRRMERHHKKFGATSRHSSSQSHAAQSGRSMSIASRWKWWKKTKKTPILFYERGKPYYEFTNFAAFPVCYQDRLYPTSEHLYQALKFIGRRSDLAERIRNAPSARQALIEATNNRQKQRSDWYHVNLNMMDRALHAKFTQHAELRDMLLGTGDRLLIENSPVDDFWGTGKSGRGQNELGKALMRLRNQLRHEAEKNAVMTGVNAHVFSNQTRRRSQSRGEEKPLPTVPLQPHPDIVPQSRAASVEPQHGKRRRGANAPSVYRKLKGRFSSTPEVIEDPIYFYDRDQPYYEFTNVSPHEVWYDGKLYPTPEHLFQAQRFMQTAPDIAEHIRMQPSSKLALSEARRLREHCRSDWFKVNRECMDLALEAKFTQHSSLHQLLLSTGDRGLVEASPVDPFWGYGRDKKGKNELGKALMRLRAQLRAVEEAQRQGQGQVVPVGRGRSRSTSTVR